MPTEAYERAVELSERAREDPDAVDRDEVLGLLSADSADARRYAVETFRALDWPAGELDDVIPRLREAIDADDAPLQNAAVQALIDVAARDVDAVDSTVDDVAALLDHEQGLVESSAVEFLYHVATSDPDAVRPHVEDLLDAFEPDRLGGERTPLYCLAAVAREYPDPFVDRVDPFVEAFVTERDDGIGVSVRDVENPLDADRIKDVSSNATELGRNHRTVAGIVLVAVAHAEPAALEPRLEDVAAFLDDPDPQVQGVAVDVVGALATEFPERVREHLPTLAGALEDPPVVSSRAANALAALSQVRPTAVGAAVAPHVEALADLLDHEDAEVRSVAAGLLSYVGEESPEAVEPVLDDVRPLLDDDSPLVRGNAVWALGVAGDRSDRERLVERRDGDPDPEVREAAAEALERL